MILFGLELIGIAISEMMLPETLSLLDPMLFLGAATD
jgi:hypothetical protein